jgi:4-cresol dehydrogenase (hydroxylating) flavoprotein subunit
MTGVRVAGRLPEGVDEARFRAALAKLREVVGDEWVIVDELGLRSYWDHHSPVPEDLRAPSAAVCPDGIDEIRAILAIANEHRLPLWTIGTGKNFAYGGPSPRRAGTIVLDLRRMNRVLEVNEDLAYALVEPGVSYFQLYEHLRATKSRLWIDCAAVGWGGIVGNALEHGAGYTPYADHFIMQCGMEVILADGTVVRTGMGAMPKSRAWQVFKYGYGPHVDGLFTQSNFGVVTKMGIWLMPEPPAYKPFLVTLPREEDLRAAMEILRPLKLAMVIPNGVVISNALYEVAVQRTKREIHDGKGPVPAEVVARIAGQQGLGAWNAYGALYGTPLGVERSWEIVRGSFSRIPGAHAYSTGERTDAGWEYREKLMRGVPSMTEFGIVNWAGGGHINFTPVAPVAGDDAMKMFGMMRRIINEHGFDYIAEFVATWRAMINVLMLMFDPADADARERAHRCSATIITEAARAGYGELKANLEFMDLVAGTFDAYDGALWKVHRRLKKELDPDGILSPGKSGI